MIAPFLKFFVGGLLRFIADCATKQWKHLYKKGEIYKDGVTQTEDFYVKEIIDTLAEERKKFCPFVINGNMYTIFRIPILGETVHFGTYINGLKTLHTADICGVSRKAGQLNISASLDAGPLELQYQVFVKLAHIERLLDIKISLDYCKIHANFSIDPGTGRNGSLRSLCIEEFRGVGFSIKGFGLWLYLPSLIGTVFVKLLKGVVRNIVEFKLEEHVDVILQSYQFPIEGKKLEFFSEDSSEDQLSDELSEGSSELSEQSSDNSTEIDEESFKKDLSIISEKILPKHAKVKKPMWYTNLPLFVDTIEERGTSNEEYEDSDINIQFQFSKNTVVKEDIEPLTRSERPKCYVFLKGPIFPQEAQFCNETSELLKSDIAKVSRSEDLMDSKLRRAFQSGVELGNSPDKYSKDSLVLLNSPVSEGSNLSGSEQKTTSNIEAADGKVEKLFNKFLVDYPKFVALTRHCEETTEIGDSNENCKIDSNNIVTDPNEENSSCNEKECGHTEVDSQNGSGETGKCTSMDNAGKFRVAKYLELCAAKYLELSELKTAFGEETLDGHNNLKFGNSLAINKALGFNQDLNQNKFKSYNLASEKIDSCIENEDVLSKKECLPNGTQVKNLVKYPAIKVETPKYSNRFKKIPSIFKWDREYKWEMAALKSKNAVVNRQMNSLTSPSLVRDYLEKTSLEPLEKVEILNVDKIVSLDMLPNLKENNETFVKFGIRSPIEQFDAIADSVFRCFDHACTDLLTSAFYLPQNESNSTYYDGSLETDYRQVVLIEDLPLPQFPVLNEKPQTEETDENFNSFPETCLGNNLTLNALNITSEIPSTASDITVIKQYDDIKEIERECEELMTANAEIETVYDSAIMDDDYYLNWVPDDESTSPDISSESEEEEVVLGEPKLCTESELKYTSNCMEGKTKLVEAAIGEEKMKLSSPVRIEEILASKDTSVLNSETINHVNDSLNDSNGGTTSKETPIFTVDDMDDQIDVNLKTDIDVPVKINEESTDFYDGELIDSSDGNLPESSKFEVEAQSEKVISPDIKLFEKTESFEICSPQSSLGDDHLQSYVFIDAQGTETEQSENGNDEQKTYSYDEYIKEALETDFADRMIGEKPDSEEREYLPSMIDGSSDPCLNVGKMEQLSPETITEVLDSEVIFSNTSSALNTETINRVEDSFNNSLTDSLTETFLNETPINTGYNLDFHMDVDLKIGINTPVNINESLGSNNLESLEYSLPSYVLINPQGTEYETANEKDDKLTLDSHEVHDNNAIQANVKLDLADFVKSGDRSLDNTYSEHEYLLSLIYDSLSLNGNEDYSKENEFGSKNTLENVEVDVATCDGVQNIESLPECLNSETAYNCPDSEVELKDGNNVDDSFEDEIIQSKLLQGKVVIEGFNQGVSSLDKLRNSCSEDSPKIAIEICLHEQISQKDIELEDAMRKPEQENPNGTMTNEPFEKRLNTVCKEDSRESTENPSCSSVEKEDNLNLCTETVAKVSHDDNDSKLELDDTNSKEQAHLNDTMANEHLRKSPSTENLAESIENANHDIVEIVPILNHCTDKTEPVNIEEQVNEQFEEQYDENWSYLMTLG